MISFVIGCIDIETKRLLSLLIPQKILQFIHHYLGIVARVVVGMGSPVTSSSAILHLAGRGYLKMRLQIIHTIGNDV